MTRLAPLLLEGEAITYDSATCRWLVELATFRGARVEWCAADRLTVILDRAAMDVGGWNDGL